MKNRNSWTGCACLGFGLILLHTLTSPSPALSETSASPRRALALSGRVTVSAGQFTLAELAKTIGDPNLLVYNDSTATLYGSLMIEGPTAELIIGPGETLRLHHMGVPSGEVPSPQRMLDRRIFLSDGSVEWKDCRIEGFYWISVDPSMTGSWENVSFSVADDHDSYYEPIQFGSSHLSWRGGEVDARHVSKVLLPSAPWEKTDTRAKIEQVSFQSAGRVMGPLPVVGIRSNFRFVDCTFSRGETTPADDPHWFSLEAHTSERGLCHVRLENPVFQGNPRSNWEDLIRVTGSGAEASLHFDGKESITIRDAEHLLETTSHSTSFDRIATEARQLRDRLSAPTVADSTGSLWWPGMRLDELEEGWALSDEVGWFGEVDLSFWKERTTEVATVLDGVARMEEVGSRFRPGPQEFPWIVDGVAQASRVEGGTVTLTTQESQLIYNPNGDAERFAGFTANSTIRERPLMDADSVYGPISIRVTGKTPAFGLDGHYQWKTRVTKSSGSIAGMEAWIPDGVTATILIFGELPDVILFDVNSHQVRYQSYANGSGEKYNGHRLWNDDPHGIRRTFAQEKLIPLSDPKRGVFLATQAGEWYRTTLSRGFITAAWHGLNDWSQSPPCGCLIRTTDFDTSWTSWIDEYISYIVQINSRQSGEHPNIEDWEESSQMLYVEGAGLGCWENIEVLDRAWNHPLNLRSTVLEPGKKCFLQVEDMEGFHRPVEVVILPSWCGMVSTERDLYRGAHTVFLLRDIAANATVALGELPLEAVRVDDKTWSLFNGGDQPIPNLSFRVPRPESGFSETALRIAGRMVPPETKGEEYWEFPIALPPGETVCRLVHPNE